MTNMITTHILTADTEATLLLCGRLGQARHTDTAPLTPTEYARLARWLLDAEKRPADLLGADARSILENEDPPLPVTRLLALLDRGGALALAIEGWSNRGLWVISRSDNEIYPQRLRASRSSPPVLYGAGNAALLSKGGLAIVGSRNADENALDFTRRLARTCAEQSIQVVSGGARGVDTEAMLACLDAGGSAIGVLADSLAKVALSRKYREALLDERLALVSAYDPASGFDRGNAMGRNKYIYALADHALVVSSATEGGTWAGAIEELRQGRTPVFVRDAGNIPEGNRKLQEKGALSFPPQPWVNLAGSLESVGPRDGATRLTSEVAEVRENNVIGETFQQGQLLPLNRATRSGADR